MNGKLLGGLLGVFLLPLGASAQPVLVQRCLADDLGASRAEARVEWMRQCALAKLSPGNHMGGEYIEPTSDPSTGRDAYVGLSNEYEINYTYLNLLYKTGETFLSVDANGYYKLTRAANRKKARPLYPVYGTQAYVDNATQLFPHPTLATCNFYFDRNATQPAPVSFYVNGFCEANNSELSSGTPLTATGTQGSATVYSLAVPPGASRVLFETSGGTGDVDIYVRFNAAPTLSTYDCRPYLGGNTEGCNMTAPAAGTWYVMLHGYSAYSGVTLKGTVY